MILVAKITGNNLIIALKCWLNVTYITLNITIDLNLNSNSVKYMSIDIPNLLFALMINDLDYNVTADCRQNFMPKSIPCKVYTVAAEYQIGWVELHCNYIKRFSDGRKQ